MWGWWSDPKEGEFRDLLLDSLVEKGGQGSGHHHHAGRRGEVGGSLPSGNPVEARARQKYGLTNDLKQGGFIFTNGDILKMRGQDTKGHGEVAADALQADPARKPGDPAPDASEKTVRLFQAHTGAVRYVLTKEMAWVQLVGMPSGLQKAVIAAMELKTTSGTFAFDLLSPDGLKPIASGMNLHSDELFSKVNRALKEYAAGMGQTAAGRIAARATIIKWDTLQWAADEDDDLVLKGGKGSGHRGHKGRPGVRGGSAPRAGGAAAKPGVEAKPGHKPGEVPSEDLPPPLEPPPPKWLTDQAEITDIEGVGEGISGKSKGKIGKHKVLVAPEVSQHPRRFEREDGKGGNFYEMAAQIMNNALERPVDFPPGILRQTELHDRTFVQEWRAGGRGKGFRDASEEERAGMGFFDAVIGNLDRHGHNLVVDKANHLIAIDHNLAFPTSNASQMINDLALLDRPRKLTADESRRLDNVVLRRGEIDSALGKYLQPAEIYPMWQRIDYMRRNKEIAWAGGNKFRDDATAAASIPPPPKFTPKPAAPAAPAPKAPSLPGIDTGARRVLGLPTWDTHGREVLGLPPAPKPKALPPASQARTPSGTPGGGLRRAPVFSSRGTRYAPGHVRGVRAASSPPDRLTEALLDALFAPIIKGSETSGNYGHEGRPGLVGGSAPSGTTPATTSGTPPKTPASQDLTVQSGEISDTDAQQITELLRDPKNILDIEQLTDEAYGSTIFIADIKGWGQVTIKPEAGQRSSYLREVIKPGREINREFAARIVNDAMGKPTIMPSIALHDFGSVTGPTGQPIGRAMVYDYVPGTSLLGVANQGAINARGLGLYQETPAFEHMGLLDATIGNLDRHNRNILVDQYDSLVAIDHDETFPARNAGHDETQASKLLGVSITTAERAPQLRLGELRRLDVLARNQDAVTTKLRPYLKDSEINAMWQRVDEMRNTRQIYTLGPHHHTQGFYHTPQGRLGPEGPMGPAYKPGKTQIAAAAVDEIAYFDAENTEVGSTWLHDGEVASVGAGVGDDQMFVAQPGKPNIVLTPADGVKWLQGLLATARTEYCHGKLRTHK